MLLGPPGHTWPHTNPWGRQDALHTGWQSVPHPPKTVSGHTPRAGVPGMGGQGAIGGATYPHPGGHNTHPRWRPTLPTPPGAPPLIRKIRKDKSCFPATCAISASLPCCLEGKDWSVIIFRHCWFLAANYRTTIWVYFGFWNFHFWLIIASYFCFQKFGLRSILTSHFEQIGEEFICVICVLYGWVGVLKTL